MSVLLIVEDEAVLRRATARAMERLPDVQVLTAATLADARAHLAEQAPNLVISDINLPDGAGVDLLAEIERSARPVPVIFVSAWLGRYRDQIPQRDDIEIFEKPVPMETLRHKVLEHLERSRAAAPAPFGLPDYLQLAAMGRHSMLLRIKRGREQVGWLRVVQGDAWAAAYEGTTGEAAAKAAVVAQGLRVEVEPWPGEPGPRDVHQPIDFLLLEAFRLHDEATRPPGAVAPEDTPPRDSAAQVDALLDRGLDALLSRDYPNAWAAFSEADALRPGDPVVRANLNRMRQMGHAPD